MSRLRRRNYGNGFPSSTVLRAIDEKTLEVLWQSQKRPNQALQPRLYDVAFRC
jgi:hypothetical protein